MLQDILNIFWPRTYKLSNGKEVKEKINLTPYAIIVLVLISIVFAKFTEFDFSLLIKKSDKFWDLVKRMFPPAWDFFKTLQKPMIDTIVMSILGTTIGCLIALPISFYLSTNFKLNKTYLVVHRGILSIFRTLPTLIYAQLISIVIGTGEVAGTAAIAVFTYTVAVKMLYEQIETCDMGPYEAIESTGAKRVYCMMKAIYPQIRGYFWSTVLYCFEMNVRSAAILGYVGAGGIGVLINQELTWRNYDRTGLMILILVITVVVIETVSRTIRKKLVQG